MAEFPLGPASLKELTAVHPDIVKVVRRALELSAQEAAGLPITVEQVACSKVCGGLSDWL